MKVYIANFGSGDWAWPECLARNAIAVMDDERVHSIRALFTGLRMFCMF
jgi:hypothetical protein